MKTVIICPKCLSDKHVYKQSTSEKVGSIIGGSLGIVLTTCVAGLIPPTLSGTRLLGLSRVLTGFVVGSDFGQHVGKHIDDTVITTYKCGHCRITFTTK